ncbi:MAG: hypothetical protein ACOYL6_01650 [Bacteriovoracaceae bacterium]
MSPIVKVRDTATQTELFTCPLEEIEQAYHYARKMEQMGLDVYVDAPSITRTLAMSLGIEDERLTKYENSITQEMEDHDCSSCASELSKDHSKE